MYNWSLDSTLFSFPFVVCFSKAEMGALPGKDELPSGTELLSYGKDPK